MIAMARLQPAFARALPDAAKRRDVLARMRNVTANVECPHTESQVLAFMIEVLALPSSVEGVIVEAGSFKGGSTAKLSFAAALAGRKLVVFDSFQGLPRMRNRTPRASLGTRSRAGSTRVSPAPRGGPEQCGDLRSPRKLRIQTGLVRRDDASAGQACMCGLPRRRPCIVDAHVPEVLCTPVSHPAACSFSQDGDFPLVIEVDRATSHSCGGGGRVATASDGRRRT